MSFVESYKFLHTVFSAKGTYVIWPDLRAPQNAVQVQMIIKNQGNEAGAGYIRNHNLMHCKEKLQIFWLCWKMIPAPAVKAIMYPRMLLWCPVLLAYRKCLLDSALSRDILANKLVPIIYKLHVPTQNTRHCPVDLEANRRNEWACCWTTCVAVWFWFECISKFMGKAPRGANSSQCSSTTPLNNVVEVEPGRNLPRDLM